LARLFGFNACITLSVVTILPPDPLSGEIDLRLRGGFKSREVFQNLENRLGQRIRLR